MTAGRREAALDAELRVDRRERRLIQVDAADRGARWTIALDGGRRRSSAIAMTSVAT